jgi:hypothetical protein
VHEPDVLVCVRIADLPLTPVASTRGECGTCGEPVWIADSSPKMPVVWCTLCFMNHGLNEGDMIAVTHEQLRDVLDHL